MEIASDIVEIIGINIKKTTFYSIEQVTGMFKMSYPTLREWEGFGLVRSGVGKKVTYKGQDIIDFFESTRNAPKKGKK